MKKFITIILLAAMLLNVFVLSACAEAANGARNSNYFDYYGVNLTDQGDGRIKIVFSAGGTGVCDSIGVATYMVEKLNENGDWVDVTGLLSGKTASGVTSYSYSKYFNGVEGETYYVQATFICTIDGSTETKAYSSPSITTK
ncbi:MAG: hypothetical protein IJ466_01315 [Clostridia bacterium]|nr:hypothetical protein [Clostridia bacterium]